MHRRLLQFTLGLVLCQAVRASAAGLDVSPVQLYLSKDETKTQLSVRNEGSEPARFQLAVYEWAEDPDKGMQLQPTKDIIFFPQLLTLKPNEQRTVRVGALPPLFGLVEKTYRLFIEELPPAQKPGQQSQVRVLTRVGIPIFLSPTRKLDRPQVALRLEDKAIVADARNDGNVHFRVNTVQLKAFDAAGVELIEKQQQGWYVLAGSHKPYRFELQPGTCAKARRLIVVVKTADERTYSQSLDVPAGTCGK